MEGTSQPKVTFLNDLRQTPGISTNVDMVLEEMLARQKDAWATQLSRERPHQPLTARSLIYHPTSHTPAILTRGAKQVLPQILKRSVRQEKSFHFSSRHFFTAVLR
ncbi:hypothetical protein BaRGS_00001500 [Batillaria attramentaria]|uniref:Uncharacterized protein n=1 Tax=Batillaria attramentaria TaxID=370345 RepID=A0ABD0M770_9CAEN